MCHKLLKQYFLVFTALLSAATATAQQQTFETKSNRENAPYSRFGIGEFRNGINPAMKGMGSITSAYTNPFTVNTDNPASYASLLLTTYEGSVQGSTRTITSGNDKYRTGMATINTMNMGIPVGKNGGMCIGYRPMNHTYFNLQDTADIAGYSNSLRTFFGDGSMHYGFIGGAYRYKGLSVGANFGYLFGTTVYATRIESIDNTQNVNDAQFARIIQNGGIYWNAGAIYSFDFDDKLFMNIGGTFTLNQTLSATTDEYWIGYNFSGTDTAYSALASESTMTLPMKFSFGVQIADSSKWVAGIDFSAMNWTGYKSTDRIDSVADMSYRIGFGTQYTPDATSLRNYFSRVAYRIGAYYGTDYVLLRNTPLPYYALTLGAGLPFKRTTDRVNMSLEIGRRGTDVKGLFKESFLKFNVGVSLNDRWFIKRRYD